MLWYKVWQRCPLIVSALLLVLLGCSITHASPAAATPSGEIWTWVLGRNVYDDPALRQYTRNIGYRNSSDISVQSEGFQLHPDAKGNVTSITLFNNEWALGLPCDSSCFLAYPGILPMGLPWSATAGDILENYPPPYKHGGLGAIPIQFRYSTKDGWLVVELEFMAESDRDLPGSPLHSITVSPGPNYVF